MSCGVGPRQGSDPALLWLWHRPVAITPIRPLVWEPPYAPEAAQENAKKTKKKQLPLRRTLIKPFLNSVKTALTSLWLSIGDDLIFVFSYRNAAHGFSLIQVDNTKVTMKEILLKAVKRRKGSQKISGGRVKSYPGDRSLTLTLKSAGVGCGCACGGLD